MNSSIKYRKRCLYEKKRVLYAIVSCMLMIGLICVYMLFFGNERATYTVIFRDYDNTILKTEVVKEGEPANAPEEPKCEGYTFVGWNKDYSSIIKDSIIVAEYIHNTDTMFVVDTVTVPSDKSVAEVKVSVVNNPGILGMPFSLNYDEKAEMSKWFGTFCIDIPGTE